MPSYTVTYGDDRPSSPSRTFANPAHGIMGVLGTSGPDPRERGRKRSRQEIEASSRAEYLARKEYAAKIREDVIKQKESDKLEREQKSADARAAESSKALWANPEAARREVARLQTAAQDKAKKEALAARGGKAERLTPEQIAAKEKAIVDRDRSNATSRIATMDKLMSERMKPEGPSLMDSLNKPVTINDWLGTSGPDLRPEQYPAQYDHSADDAARAAAPAARAKPAAPAAPLRMHGRAAPAVRGDDSDSPFYVVKGGEYNASESPARMRPFIGNPNFKEDPDKPYADKDKDGNPRFINGENSPEFRKQAEDELMNRTGRATPAAAPAAPAAPISDRYVRPEDREPSFSFIEGRGGYSGDTMYGLGDPTKSPAAMRPFMENPNYKPGPNDPDKYVDANGNPRFLHPEDSAALKKHIEAELTNPMGSAIPKTPDRLATRVDDSGPTWSGVKKFGSDVGETLRGIKDTVDMGVGTGATQLGSAARAVKDTVDSGLGSLFEASAPQFDRANAGAARMGQGIADAGRSVAEFADRPLSEGGLRFDPGVAMPPQREVGGATGGSIGAPTKKRTGVNPTSIYELLDQLLPKAMKDPNSMYYFPGKYY